MQLDLDKVRHFAQSFPVTVKHALGELSDEELAAYQSRIRPSRRALRYFDQLEYDD